MVKKILFGILLCLCEFQSCSLFPDVEKILIYEYPYNNDTLRFYYISANATSQNVMQISLSKYNGMEQIIGNYERFNNVISVDISIDNVKIVISDTSSYIVSVDTIYIDHELLKKGN
jgi:hypothetical protein